MSIDTSKTEAGKDLDQNAHGTAASPSATAPAAPNSEMSEKDLDGVVGGGLLTDIERGAKNAYNKAKNALD